MGRGRRAAAALLGLALLAAFAAAPAAAQNLERPVVTSTPASGSTYLPGETIVVQVRPRSSPWVSITSATGPTLGLNVGGSVKSLSGDLQVRRFSYSYYDTDLRETVTRSRETNVLEFRYTVQKGDRDTDGVSVAANALGGGNIGANVGGSQFVGGTWYPNLSKNHSQMRAQSGHKVDTPAPSWSGVTAPDIIFYAGGSVSYRLPQVANAASAHNVSYSVTSARSLPTGYTLNASTGTITGSYGSASARNSYTLRATDGFGRTADLTFHLQVSADAGIESISITSNPGADNTYGKVAPFGTNDTITVRVDFTHRLTTILGSRVCLNIRIGSNIPRVCNPSSYTSDSSRWDKLDFSYAVQAGDWDGDGISFPTNPMGAGKDGGLRFRITGVGTDNRVNRSFGPTLDDANHKVRGEQTVPSFGSTATPSYSWVKGNAVSQALPAVPAATDGDGGVTYAIEGSLPAGLSFAAATRTISGTPTAAQGATNYTLAATDGDGDRATLRFSIEIEEIAVSISSPSVAEGEADGAAILKYGVTLNRAPGRQVTVDYAAAADPGTAEADADYAAITGGTLTFAAAGTSRTFDVTVKGDALDEPDETVRIALSNPSGAVLGSASTGVGTITDDDPTPTLALALSASTIDESGAGNATTVTASLSGGISGEAITVTVTATGATAAAGDFTLSSADTLTIAAGATASTGTVTVTAAGDATDEPDETATVGGTVAGGHGLVAAPAGVTLTIVDDDDAPGVTLALSPASVSENGGVSTVTATLTNPSSAATTVTVTAAAVTGLYTVGSDATIVIAAGETANAADTALIVAVDDDVHQGTTGRSTTVTGTAANAQAAANSETVTVTGAPLTLTDDEALPEVTLVLSPTSISESSGVSTVQATLSRVSSEAVTVTVSAAPGTGAIAADFSLSSNRTLTIAAGNTTSGIAVPWVTVTANGNTVDSPDKSVTVSGTATGGNGVAAPSDVTLTLTDDEDPPEVTLVLSPASISETGGVSTVTATLSRVSSAAVTVTVSATGVTAAAGDFSLSSADTLTIASGSTTSSGAVTVTAEGDTTDEPNETVSVSGTATGGNGVANPDGVTLTIADDDVLPTVTLALSSSSISEGSGVTTVTAALSGESSEAVTVTVSASPGSGTDFTLSTANTLTIAAGSTASTGAVTLTALNNDVEESDKTVTVSGAASGGNGVSAPAGLPLTITDNDGSLPSGGTSWRNSAFPTSNWDVTTESLLGKTASQPIAMTGTYGTGVTDVWACANKTVGQTSGSASVPGPSSDDCTQLSNNSRPTTIALTQAMIDNDGVVIVFTIGTGGANVQYLNAEWVPIVALPKATLSLSSSSIAENGGVSTVTATLDKAALSAATLTVSAPAGDLTLSAAATLTFATGATASTGTVTVTAVSNTTDAPDKRVSVSAAASGDVRAPPDATLTITDDDAAPRVLLALSLSSIAENGGESMVSATLSRPSSAATTVTVTAVTGFYTVGSDATIVIPAGSTSNATDTVTIAAVGDDVHQGSGGRSTTVTGTAVNSQGVGEVTLLGATPLTLEDDEALPTLALALSDPDPTNPETIFESWSGASTVTATLSGASSAAVTVTVAATGATAAAGDFTLSSATTLTIAAGATTSTGTVTVAPVDDTTDEADETVTVSATVSGGNGVAAPSSVTLTIRDDDAAPGVTLSLSPSSISENGGESTVTATLTHPSSAATTVTVTAAAVTGFYTLGSDATIVIAAGETANAADTATVAAVDDDVHQGTAGRSTTVTGTAANAQAAANSETVTVSGATLTLTDDEDLPEVTLVLSPTSISEMGGVATVTATLSDESSEAVTVTVGATGATAAAGDFGLSSDRTLTIAAGATTSTGTVTVTAVDDTTDEADETVTVSGTAAGGNGVVAPSSQTLTLTDDDPTPTLSLSLSASTIDESGAGNATTVTASLSGGISGEAITVTVTATGATAAAGDFTLSSADTLTIAAGATASTGTVTVTARGRRDGRGGRDRDGGRDSGRRVRSVAAPSGVTLTITDDDALPTLSLSLFGLEHRRERFGQRRDGDGGALRTRRARR